LSKITKKKRHEYELSNPLPSSIKKKKKKLTYEEFMSGNGSTATGTDQTPLSPGLGKSLNSPKARSRPGKIFRKT